MSADVIKEFFVGLGWKVDQAGERKFKDTIATATKQVALLTVALEAAAVATAYAVAKIAAGFDTLYFSSQRTGASVQNIKALQYAFSQVGSSSEAAAGAIEAYAKAIRTNPGVGQYVKDLGVKQTGDAFNDLSAAIDKIQAKNPYYAGAQMAGLLGISEEQYQTFTKYRKEIVTYRAEYEKFTKQFGLNNEEAAKSSASFMRGLNSLGTMATVVGQKFLVALAPAFDRVVKGILSWIDANPEKIERIFNAIAVAAEWVAKAFKAVWDTGVQLFDFLSAKAEEMTSDGSFLRMWEKVVTVFERVANAIKSVLTWVRELDRATDMSGGLRQLGRILGWIEGKTSGFVEGGAAAAGAVDRITQTSVGVPEAQAKPGLIQRGVVAAKRALGIGGVSDNGPRVSQSGNVPSSQRGREQRAMARLVALGWTPQAAASAVGQAVEESSVRSDGPLGDTGRFGTGDDAAHGMFQWRAGRFRALKKFAEGRNKNWQDFDTQVDFFDQERKQRSQSERNWHKVTDLGEGNRIGKQFEQYGGGLQAQREAHARRLLSQYKQAPGPEPITAPAPTMPKGFSPGGFDVNRLGAQPMGASASSSDNSRSVTQNNPINVTINGASDPATTASAAERAVGRANDLSLRNAQSAIR